MVKQYLTTHESMMDKAYTPNQLTQILCNLFTNNRNVNPWTPFLLETSTNHRTNHALISVSTSSLIPKMARLQQTNTLMRN